MSTTSGFGKLSRARGTRSKNEPPPRSRSDLVWTNKAASEYELLHRKLRNLGYESLSTASRRRTAKIQRQNRSKRSAAPSDERAHSSGGQNPTSAWMILGYTRRVCRWSAGRLGLVVVLATALLCSRVAFACSGAGAERTILRNEILGWVLWASAVLIALVVALVAHARAQGRRIQWPLPILVVVHPGWWMSARSGDCGYTLRDGSIFMTALALVIGGITCWRATRGSSSPRHR